MLKKIFLLLFLLLLVAAAFLRFSHLPEPFPKDSQSAHFLEPGRSAVSYFDINLVDDTRPTQRNGDFAGSNERLLKTRIWHPKRLGTPRPLIIYSHGFMSQRRGGDYLAEHLASHGYIVAAMDYPLTHFSAPGGPLVKDVVHQPDDIRFLLDQFLSWSADPANDFYHSVDDGRIGVMGLSLGGLTSTLVAFHPQWHDPRIDAAISIAGPGFMFSPVFFRSHPLPYMMIASPQDAMVDYSNNAEGLLDEIDDAVLVTIEGASHTGFAGVSRYLRWLDNPDWLGCSQLTRTLGDTQDADWWGELGGADQGIIQSEVPALCSGETLPKSMNTLRQQQLTTVSVFAFFESHFALSRSHRLEAKQFLLEGLGAEMKEVSVRRAH